MVFVLNDARQGARCDRCGLLTPVMHVACSDAAMQILRAAGWLVRSDFACCPRCRATPRIEMGVEARAPRAIAAFA